MADTGTTILNLPATVALNDTDVIPLARPSGTTAPGSDLGLTGAALKALFGAGGPATSKGGVFRGPWAANTVYAQYDCVIAPASFANAGLFVYATVAFTSPATYTASNWTLDPGQSTNDYTSPEKTTLAGLNRVIHVGTNAGNGNQAPVSVGGYLPNVTGLESASVGGGAITISGNDSGSVAGSKMTISGINSGSVGGTQSGMAGNTSALVGGFQNNNNADEAAIIGGRGLTLPVGATDSAIIGGIGFTAPALPETAFMPQAYVFKPGAGISLLSPDGTTRRVLTIDNAGNLVISPPAGSAPTVSNASFTAA